MGSRPELRLLLRRASQLSVSRTGATSRCPTPTTLTSQLHTSNSLHNEIDTEAADRPRWQATPRAMRAPVRTRPLPPNNAFTVNSSPAVLNAFYDSLLASHGGAQALTEETRWLAVTHRSFDHGRRGFNDRLAFLGKRVVDVQVSLSIVSEGRHAGSPLPPQQRERPDSGQASALAGVERLEEGLKASLLKSHRLASLAVRYGFHSVIRWKPKQASDINASGIHVVAAGSLYAVVGAIALERGGEEANRFVRGKILTAIGLGS